LGQQSLALTQLAEKQALADPLDPLSSGGGYVDDAPMRLGRGPAALEALHRRMNEDPNYITERVAANCQRQQAGASSMELSHGQTSMKGFLVKQVAFHRNRGCTYFFFMMAEIFELLLAGQWEKGRGLLAMCLVAAEQAALDQWNWGTAWLLTGLPDPPFHLIQESLGAHLTRPGARLADHTWINAAANYLKDMAVLHETRRQPTRQMQTDLNATEEDDKLTRKQRQAAAKQKAAAGKD